MEINSSSISQNVIKYRLKARINQKQLAALTELHANYISDIENDRGILPSMDSLSKIAEVLNISVDMLLYENLSAFQSDETDDTIEAINKEIHNMSEDKKRFLLDFLTVYSKHKGLDI